MICTKISCSQSNHWISFCCFVFTAIFLWYMMISLQLFNTTYRLFRRIFFQLNKWNQTNSLTFAEAEIVSGGDMLVRSAEAVREAYADTDPHLREAINKGENPIIDISVSFDGTWQKRGFTSLYGVSIWTDVLTGYVVDHVVLSKYCHACKLQEAKNLPEAELAAWREGARCRLLPEPPSVQQVHGAGGSKDHVVTLSGKVQFLLCGDVEWRWPCPIQSYVWHCPIWWEGHQQAGACEPCAQAYGHCIAEAGKGRAAGTQRSWQADGKQVRQPAEFLPRCHPEQHPEHRQDEISSVGITVSLHVNWCQSTTSTVSRRGRQQVLLPEGTCEGRAAWQPPRSPLSHSSVMRSSWEDAACLQENVWWKSQKALRTRMSASTQQFGHVVWKLRFWGWNVSKGVLPIHPHSPSLTPTHTPPHLPVKVGHLLHGPDFDDFAGILFLVVIIGEAVVSVDVLLSSAKVHQGCLVDLHSHIWRDLLSLHTVNTTNISTFCELSYSTQQTWQTLSYSVDLHTSHIANISVNSLSPCSKHFHILWTLLFQAANISTFCGLFLHTANMTNTSSWPAMLTANCADLWNALGYGYEYESSTEMDVVYFIWLQLIMDSLVISDHAHYLLWRFCLESTEASFALLLCCPASLIPGDGCLWWRNAGTQSTTRGGHATTTHAYLPPLAWNTRDSLPPAMTPPMDSRMPLFTSLNRITRVLGSTTCSWNTRHHQFKTSWCRSWWYFYSRQ